MQLIIYAKREFKSLKAQNSLLIFLLWKYTPRRTEAKDNFKQSNSVTYSNKSKTSIMAANLA